MRLNYHHLRYFQEVAREGNLTRAAAMLNLSQSALSTQIRQLEERLGHPLFERTGRAMTLTEAGRIALDHAERIFGVGDDLVATLTAGGAAKAPLRVGALSTLSRNFQLRFLRPALARDVELVLSSGNSRYAAEIARGSGAGRGPADRSAAARRLPGPRRAPHRRTARGPAWLGPAAGL